MTTIQVTQKHIDEGVPGECDRCPIALAMHDALKLNVSVGDYDCWTDEYVEVELPKEAKIFVHDFDRLEPVHPFSFEIDERGLV